MLSVSLNVISLLHGFIQILKESDGLPTVSSSPGAVWHLEEETETCEDD